MMRKGVGLFLGALLTAALAPAAGAATLTYYVDVFGAPVQVAGTTPLSVNTATLSGANTNSIFFVPGFVEDSPGPGLVNRLTNVALILTWRSQGTVQIINLAASPTSFSDAFAVLPMAIGAPGPTVVNATTASYVAAGSVAPFPPVVNFSTSENTGSSTNNVANGQLGLYSGASPFNLSFNVTNGAGSFGGTESGGGGNLFFGGTAQAGAILEIVYTYDAFPETAIPEPFSMLLVSPALLIGWAVRRRRA